MWGRGESVAAGIVDILGASEMAARREPEGVVMETVFASLERVVMVVDCSVQN